MLSLCITVSVEITRWWYHDVSFEIFGCSNVHCHEIMMWFPTKIIACCDNRCSYQRFSYPFWPRAESATFCSPQCVHVEITRWWYHDDVSIEITIWYHVSVEITGWWYHDDVSVEITIWYHVSVEITGWWYHDDVSVGITRWYDDVHVEIIIGISWWCVCWNHTMVISWWCVCWKLTWNHTMVISWWCVCWNHNQSRVKERRI